MLADQSGDMTQSSGNPQVDFTTNLSSQSIQATMSKVKLEGTLRCGTKQWIVAPKDDVSPITVIDGDQHTAPAMRKILCEVPEKTKIKGAKVHLKN